MVKHGLVALKRVRDGMSEIEGWQALATSDGPETEACRNRIPVVVIVPLSSAPSARPCRRQQRENGMTC